MFVVRPMSDDRALRIFTAPEATNTGPGFNRGFGGGARGCGFGERVGAYARTEGGSFPIAHDVCLQHTGKEAALKRL